MAKADSGVTTLTRAIRHEAHRPVWALGSAGAIESFPVIERVRHLVIWADHDKSGRGLEAANIAAARWRVAGKRVSIRNPCDEGIDYGEG